MFKDRRQWNKSNKDFNMDYPDPEVGLQVVNTKITYLTINIFKKMAEIQKRHEEYLFNLHMNNQ